MTRLSADEWALKLAEVTALRGTCIRRQVGCVLTNKLNHIIATGYNGVARGLPHCNEVVQVPMYEKDVIHSWPGEQFPITRILRSNRLTYPNACEAANSPSGTNLLACEAIHAECNACCQCRDVYTIHTAYVTASPCLDCVKMLMNTGCKRIVFRELYPHPEAAARWAKTGGEWIQLKKEI